MSTKAKSPPLPPADEAINWSSPPDTTQERRRRMRILGQRVHRQVQFMCQVGGLNGSSAEAKERAAVAFYECLAALERQLAHIQEELELL